MGFGIATGATLLTTDALHKVYLEIGRVEGKVDTLNQAWRQEFENLKQCIETNFKDTDEKIDKQGEILSSKMDLILKMLNA